MYTYPLTLRFKLLAIAPQVKIEDANKQTILYVRQKALALREHVRVFADEAQQQHLFTIQADRILDWSANYRISTPEGDSVGSVRRHGMRSLWKATYSVADADGQEIGLIHEESPILKLLDGLVGEIPLIGGLLSMFINPAYSVDLDGQPALYFKKQPSFFERQFGLEKRTELDQQRERLLLTSVIMMILLERGRG